MWSTWLLLVAVLLLRKAVAEVAVDWLRGLQGLLLALQSQ
jgi:hypothetical protein